MRLPRLPLFVSITVGLVLGSTSVTFADTRSQGAADDEVVPSPGMVITKDTRFVPGTYEFPEGEGITIAADGVTVDGNGATLVGPGVRDDPTSFAGTAVSATGRSNVTLTGLRARGFRLGLHVDGGSGWTIEDNDFSDNYDDPGVAWTDGPLAGGILLEDVDDSRIARNTAQRNWNGLTLRHSNGNTIADNQISHCSNVCLKMWRASRNVISDNDFSYGIRQQHSACQVHACDSTSALIETGSDHNEFYRNDFRHGGDGVFIRPLNGVVSTGNYFEENDGSYANNNAWESWSPGNTYVRNKANHSSYGFWLGNSDHTVMIENEAAYNGKEKANAPEDFGNAGVAVVNGSSSHFVFVGNHVHHNASPGLAIRFREDYPAFHWVIQQNRIHDNATYGIYLRHADWLDIAGNEITNNPDGAIHQDENVTHVHQREASPTDTAPKADVTISSSSVVAGEPVTFDASGSEDESGRTLAYRWDLGDGAIADTARVTHTFDEPGFYRVGVTVNNGRLADLAGFDVYVTDPDPEVLTDDPDGWTAEGRDGTVHVASDDDRRIRGDFAIRLTGDATSAVLGHPLDLELTERSTLAFWVGAEHDERAFSDGQPSVRLTTADGSYVEYTPSRNWLDTSSAPYMEARNGWQRVEIPLAGGGSWSRHAEGDIDLADVTAIEFHVASEQGRYQVWLDGLVAYDVPDVAPSIARNTTRKGEPRPTSSSGGTPWKLVDGDRDRPAWTSKEDSWIGVDFGTKREFDQVIVHGARKGAAGALPESATVRYRHDGKWFQTEKTDVTTTADTVELSFDAVPADAVRVELAPSSSEPIVVSELDVRNVGNVAGNRLGAAATPRTPTAAASSNDDAAVAALDGDLRTVWRPSSGDEAPWIDVDLGIRRSVNTVTVSSDRASKSPRVQYRARSGWADVTHVRSSTRSAGVHTVEFDNVSTTRLRVVLDGRAEVRELEVGDSNLVLRALARGRSVTPTASYTSPYDTVHGPIDGTYGATPRWTSWNSKNETDWYAVGFDGPTVIGRVDLHVYDDRGGVVPPKEYRIQYWRDEGWTDVAEIERDPAAPAAGYNSVVFEPVVTTQIRFLGVNVDPAPSGKYVGLTEFELFRSGG